MLLQSIYEENTNKLAWEASGSKKSMFLMNTTEGVLEALALGATRIEQDRPIDCGKLRSALRRSGINTTSSTLLDLGRSILVNRYYV